MDQDTTHGGGDLMAELTAAGNAEASSSGNSAQAPAQQQQATQAPTNDQQANNELTDYSQAGVDLADSPDETVVTQVNTELAGITDPRYRAALSKLDGDDQAAILELVKRLQSGDLLEKTAHEKALEDSLKSARYIDHEDGYKLSPEYVAASKKVTDGENAVDYFTQMLQHLNSGALKGKQIGDVEVNDKGELVVSATNAINADAPGAAGWLTARIAQHESRVAQHRAALEALPTQHKADYAKGIGAISKINDALFGAKPNEDFEKEAAQEIAALPAAMRAKPEIKLLGRLMALTGRMHAKLKGAGQQQVKQQQVQKARVNGAPAPSAAGKGQPTAERKEINDLVALMR